MAVLSLVGMKISIMKIGTDMKFNYSILAIAVFALLSCAREKVETPETITIRAYQEGATETRTTLIDGGTQVYWEPSDEIKVFFNGSGGRFVAQNTENVTVATFSGTINVVAGANEGTSSNYMTWGVYPYRSDATSDGKSVTTTLPSEQTGRAGSFAKNTHITLAQSEGLNLAFYNVTGGIRFSLTQEGVKEVVFQGQNDEIIAGKVKIAFVNGVPAVQEIIDGQKSITLTAPNGGTFETGKWYYLVALPGFLSNGFKMTFNTETQCATLMSSGSKTIKRGIFGSLDDADEGLVFKDREDGDAPNPDDIIQFEDQIAKYACVEKFDTNGDGEISYAEAAAVTSLDGLFADWNTVTCFEEIRFFSSVTSTEGVFTGLTNLTHITVPENIITLGSFQNCTALESVVLPSNLESLPTSCFKDCSSLVSVILPTGITSIPDEAFRYCSALVEIELPSTLVSIGYAAFSGCLALADIDFPYGLSTIDTYAFSNCRMIASLDFPTSLTSIGSDAFSNCWSMTSLDIPSTLTSIGYCAFSNCLSLASVTLPDNMTSIPGGCFSGCSKLATITWPKALDTIRSEAFYGCQFEDNDYTLQLPSSISTIERNAFGALHHLLLPSTSFISIASDAFVADYTYLYVPSNMVDLYKKRSNWSDYAERIRSLDDYPVGDPIVGGIVGEAVDLGLSVKWGSWNVGASSPEEYGAYFAWGETDVKWDYNWNTYKWTYDNNAAVFTKYVKDIGYGTIDNLTVLDLEDDAARANWGASWRMPTQREMKELIDNCNSVLTTVNGVYGLLFTSKIEGYSDRSVFFPSTGFRSDSVLDDSLDETYYWTSTLCLHYSFSSQACYLRFTSGGPSVIEIGCSRYLGLPVRPVCD